MGDFVRVEGALWRTQKGELTLGANGAELLAKALRPLPEKWHGLSDVEARYRQRYLDLLSNERTREIALLRSATLRALRTLPRRARLPRGRDAGAPADLRRRRRAPLRDAPPRLRPEALPAHLRRAVSQAARDRRARSRLRDRAQLQERGRQPQAQPRVHHARVLPGVRGLPRHDGAGAGHAGERGAAGARHAVAPARRRRDRAGRRVAAHHDARRRAERDRGGHPRRRRSREPARGALRAGHRAGRRPDLGAARGRGVQREGRAGAGAADLRHAPPDRALAAREALAGGSARGRALRAVPRRHGDRERLQRAQRPRRPARALRGAAHAGGGRRRRGAPDGRGLPDRAGARHAADGRPRRGGGSPGARLRRTRRTCAK